MSRLGPWVLVFGAWSVGGLAQTPPVFRTGTDVVEVDAVVHDKAGRPVLDLTARDFTITEDGAPEPVTFFYAVRGRAIVSPATVPGAAAEAVTLGPTVGAPIARRTFVVVLDADHLTPGGFKRAQAAATALFGKHFQLTDLGGLVTNGQMASRQLTSDRQELLNAVASAKATNASNARLFDLREWPSLNDAEAFQIARTGLRNDQVLEEVLRRACADDPKPCEREPVDVAIYEKAVRIANEIRQSSDVTLRTINTLLNELERFDGPKTILLLSEGFVADESWPILKQVVGAAARANARIYSFDARGLGGGRQPIGNYAPHDDTLGNLLASFDIGADSINSLSVDTGGYVVRNVNLFDRAVAELADEAGTYYVLGYRPQRPADGAFRTIGVKVNRPGVIVRARRGYVATAASTVSNTRTHSADPLSAAPGAPVEEDLAVATMRPLPDAIASIAASGDDRGRGAGGGTAHSSVAAAGGRVASGSEVRLRPDSAKHVENLGEATDPDVQARNGWSAYQRGDLETAHTGLAAAALAATAQPWVHYALGQTNYGLQRYAEAVRAWDRVRVAVPDFEPVYFDLVDAYLQLKDYDRATATLRDAQKRWASDADVYNALGVVQVLRSALDDAIASFERAVAVRPSEAVGYFNLAKAHELRYQKSRRYVSTLRTWVSNKQDADAATTAYQQYLALGGPLENAARDGLARLEWGRGQR